jgi:hypothetical protein
MKLIESVVSVKQNKRCLMYLGCVKPFSVSHIHTRLDVTDKVHENICHLNSNCVI